MLSLVGFKEEKSYESNARRGWNAGYFGHFYDPRMKQVSEMTEWGGLVYATVKAFVFQPIRVALGTPIGEVKHSLKLVTFVVLVVLKTCTIWKVASRKAVVFSLCAIGGSLAAIVMTPIKSIYLLFKALAGIIKRDWGRNYGYLEEKIFRASNRILSRNGHEIPNDEALIKQATKNNHITPLQEATVMQTRSLLGGPEQSPARRPIASSGPERVQRAP